MLNYIISISGENLSPELIDRLLRDKLENKFSHIEQLPGVWHLSGRKNEMIYQGTRSIEGPLNSKDIGILEEMFKKENTKILFYRLEEMQ